MGKINLEAIDIAFSQFEKMYQRYNDGFKNTELIEEEAIKESLVQRFEYTVELSWKIVARHIEEYFGLDIIKAPKPVLREAGRLEILDAQAWISFINTRNIASHTYNKNTLDSVLELMPDFYTHAKRLLDYLKNTHIDNEK